MLRRYGGSEPAAIPNRNERILSLTMAVNMPASGISPAMSKPWIDSRSEYVSRMFGAIADHYDLMNWVMTMGQDQRWRRQAADAALLRPGGSALDVATGTGHLAV